MDTNMNQSLGTKWFTFYTKVRPWLALVSVFSIISDFMQYTDVYISNWWLLLYFIFVIVQPILCIMVFVKSSGNYIDFVHFVKGVLLFETINMSYQQGVQQYIRSVFDGGSAFVMFVIIFVIMFFVWYRLNVKYFEKRVLLHSGEAVSRFECDSCGYIDNISFKACPKCGAYVYKQTTQTTNSKESKPIIATNNSEPNIDDMTPQEAAEYLVALQMKESHLAQSSAIPKDKVCFCRKCGERLVGDSRFCYKCGTEVVRE